MEVTPESDKGKNLTGFWSSMSCLSSSVAAAYAVPFEAGRAVRGKEFSAPAAVGRDNQERNLSKGASVSSNAGLLREKNGLSRPCREGDP